MEIIVDYDSSKFWLEILKVVGAVAAFIFTWWLTFWRGRKKALEDLDARIAKNKEDGDNRIDVARAELATKIEDTRHELAKTDSAVSTLSAKVDAVPSHEEVGRMYERVDDLHGDVRELIGTIGAVGRNVETIHTHLLNKGT